MKSLKKVKRNPMKKPVVDTNSFTLEFVKANPEEERNAVTMRPVEALHYVENPSKDLCLAAVRQDGKSLEHIKDQTVEMCLEAVKQDGMALRHSAVKTTEICLAAVQQNGLALAFVPVKTPEICEAAVKQNAMALQYVDDQTEEMCIYAVSKYWNALQYVKNQTVPICLAAMRNNSLAIMHVRKDLQEEVERAYKSSSSSSPKANSNYQQLFTEEANQHGFLSSQDIEAFRDELADSYFGSSSVTDPWEKAYKVLKGE